MLTLAIQPPRSSHWHGADYFSKRQKGYKVEMKQNQSRDITKELYLIADELRTIANYGLMYVKDEYDRERLYKVLEVSARLVSMLENKPVEDIISGYEGNMDHISPIIGAEAVVLRDNKLLLIKRHDDGLWAVPGGLSDIGEYLTETALRELEEETGLSGTIVRFLGIFDSRKWKSKLKFHAYHVIFEVDAGDDTPKITHEALDWGFFGADELPDLSPGHDTRVPFLFKLINGEAEIPYIDS